FADVTAGAQYYATALTTLGSIVTPGALALVEIVSLTVWRYVTPIPLAPAAPPAPLPPPTVLTPAIALSSSTVSRWSATPNGPRPSSVIVTGSGFTPSTLIAIGMPAGAPGQTLASGRTDTSGNFSMGITVPDMAGAFMVVAYGSPSAASA